MFLACGCAALW